MITKRNGVTAWIFQRLSNLAIFIYAGFYIAMILSMDTVDYTSWKALHSALWFKVYSSITLVVVMLNSIIAGWQIGTDYTQKVPVPGFAPLFHGFYTLITLAFLGFGLFILWFM